MTVRVIPKHRFAVPLLAVAPLLASCTPAEPPAPPPEPPRAMERQLTDTPYTERDADWSPDGQWIVFGSSAGGDEDLYLMPSAGGQFEQLTSGSSEDLYADWSPDGKRILFTSNRSGGNDNVWTVAPDGSDLRQVTQSSDQVINRRGHVASWSPDSQSILFSANKGRDRPGIWSIPAAGGTATQLSPGVSLHEEYGTWSPDGTEIAFAQSALDMSDIFVRNQQSGEVRLLVASSGQDWVPDWSPDGRWIAFSSWRGGTVELWVVAAGGGEPFNVTNTPERHEFVPRWSPDSRQLLFNTVPQVALTSLVPVDGATTRVIDHTGVWGRGDDELIYRDAEDRPWAWSLATGDSVRFADQAMNQGGPFWESATSPDGRFLAHVDRDAAGDDQLYLLTLDNGRSRQVTTSRFATRLMLDWSQDSRTLAFTGVALDGAVDVWTVPANGGTEVRLTQSRGESFTPTWSPDGSRIAFVHADSAGSWIHIMNADGGNRRSLVEGSSPLWSRDGVSIYYTPGAGFGRQDIYEIPVAGGTPTLLHDTTGLLNRISLSPSGEAILVRSRDPGNIFILDVGTFLDSHLAKSE